MLDSTSGVMNIGNSRRKVVEMEEEEEKEGVGGVGRDGRGG